MEKKKLTGVLKEKVQETADTVKNTVKDVKIPEIKKPDVKGIFKKSTEKKQEMTKEHAAEEKRLLEEKKEAELSKLKIQKVKALSPINALQVFYYVMAADGKISEAEEERFNLIAAQIDPEFEEHRDYVIKTCKEQLDRVIDDGDYFDVVQDGVEEALLAQQVFDKDYVPAKLLVWDLLTIAYSDDAYAETERKLLKYIVRKVDISKDVFLEMENTYLTVKDIQNEIEWIKDTDRPYRTIEKTVDELERRKQAIVESVMALIYL